MIEFQCEGCGQTVKVAESEGGREHACPYCRTVAMVPASVGYSPPVQRSSTGLAIAALVLGICGFIPCLGLLAAPLGIIFGIVVLAKKRPGRGMAAGGLAAGVISLVVYGVWIASSVPAAINAFRTLAQQMPAVSGCTVRLTAIGSAMQMYVSDRDGVFPATLQVLIDEGLLDESEPVVCPSSSPASDGGYFYLAPPAGAVGSVVVACDLVDNHEGIGRGVLFSDGEVRWMQEAQFQQMLALPPNAPFAKALAEAEAEAEVEAEVEGP